MDSIYKGLQFTVVPGDGAAGHGTVRIVVGDTVTGGARDFKYKGVTEVHWRVPHKKLLMEFNLAPPAGKMELNDAAIAMIDHLLDGAPTETSPVTVELKEPAGARSPTDAQIVHAATETKASAEQKAKKLEYFVVGSWTCNKCPPYIQFVTQNKEQLEAYLRDLGCEEIPSHADEAPTPVDLDFSSDDLLDGGVVLHCWLPKEKTKTAVAAGKLHRQGFCGYGACASASVYVYYSATGNLTKIWKDLEGSVC